MFKRLLIIYALFIVPNVFVNSQNTSKLVSVDKSGKVKLHSYSDKGDILPDFSYCGYKAGEVDLPKIKTTIEISPIEGNSDDTERIQKAINELGKKALDNRGIRGALLLKKGKYRIASPISILQSGIVLRGEGKDQTILVGTAKRQYTLIQVGDESAYIQDKASKTIIKDKYVSSGSSVFTVENPTKFKVGDDVVIERLSTAGWISFIGMDKLAPQWLPITDFSTSNIEKLKLQGLLDGSGKKYNSTIQWAPGSKNIRFQRKIVAVNGNQITIDIPLTNAIQEEFGGAEVYKYSYSNRISNVGIENLGAESLFDSTIVADVDYLDNYCSDEKHAWTFLSFNTCENVWANNLSCKYFSFGIQTKKNCRFATIQNCEVLDPVSIITGGRRYAYLFDGQMGLVKDCYSRNCRHDFVLGATVAGPNVFLNSKAELSHAASEPHHRWSAGCLWDNCEVSGCRGYISLSNRGNYGSGHGWAGAQMVLWNCKTPLAVVMAPPTAMNFSIGTTNLQTKIISKSVIEDLVSKLNKIAGKDFQYKDGIPAVGDGYIESDNIFVSPQSLYMAQLKSRLSKK